MRVDVFQMCPDLDVPSQAPHTLPSLLGRERDVGSSSGSRGRLHLQIQKQQGLWGPGRQEVGRMGRYLEEGVLEAVLLAPSTALGHEVVSPPAAEREKVKPLVQRVPADKLAPPNAKRPCLGDWAQSGAPSQRGQSRRRKDLRLGAWTECGDLRTFH